MDKKKKSLQLYAKDTHTLKAKRWKKISTPVVTGSHTYSRQNRLEVKNCHARQEGQKGTLYNDSKDQFTRKI